MAVQVKGIIYEGDTLVIRRVVIADEGSPAFALEPGEKLLMYPLDAGWNGKLPDVATLSEAVLRHEGHSSLV